MVWPGQEGTDTTLRTMGIWAGRGQCWHLGIIDALTHALSFWDEAGSAGKVVIVGSCPTLCGGTGPGQCCPEPALKMVCPQLSQAPSVPVRTPAQIFGECTEVETRQQRSREEFGREACGEKHVELTWELQRRPSGHHPPGPEC